MARRRFDIDYIITTGRERAVDETKAREIAESIAELGLMNLPAVRIIEELMVGEEPVFGAVVLIHGHHRIRALQMLGKTEVECEVYDVDDVKAKLMEIDENLRRADLTQLQRSEHIARWIELTGTKQKADEVLAQPVPKPDGGRPEGGTRAAARSLGINREDARRAVVVASLSPEAKAVASDLKLDDNRTALLAAAKEPTPAAQVAVLLRKAEPLGSQHISSECAEPDETDAVLTPSQSAEIERWQALTRQERDAERAATLVSDFARIEHLLPEIHGETIEAMSILQIASRYGPVLNIDQQWGAEGKGVRAIQKRIRDAKLEVGEALTRAASGVPPAPPVSAALAAYDVLTPDERLAFHEQRPDPTAPVTADPPLQSAVTLLSDGADVAEADKQPAAAQSPAPVPTLAKPEPFIMPDIPAALDRRKLKADVPAIAVADNDDNLPRKLMVKIG